MSKRKYVVVEESNHGPVWCHGIFDNINTALGYTISLILDFKASYRKPEDEFSYSDPYYMDGDGGYCIDVTYKGTGWTKAETDRYLILFYEEDEDE